MKFESLPYYPLRITSPYGPRDTGIPGASKFHLGVDIGMDKTKYKPPDGGPVRAVLPFKVLISAWTSVRGWYLILDHGGGITTLYQHLQKRGLPVGSVGHAGDEVGRMGDTGLGSLHLHFELHINGKPVDPMPYLQRVASEGEEDMTEAEVKKLIEESRKIYRRAADLPDWAKPTIDRMISRKLIFPDPDGTINLTHEMTRLLVIVDRMVG